MTKRRNFSDKFKAAVALEALQGDKTVQEIAAKRQLHPTQVSTWKRQAIDTDNTLNLDAGYVSIASFTFRPEVIIPIGADFVADTNTHFTYAPRLVCEQIKSTTKTSDCGTSGELGFRSKSKDGLSSADMRILLDRINGGTRSSFTLSVEHKF